VQDAPEKNFEILIFNPVPILRSVERTVPKRKALLGSVCYEQGFEFRLQFFCVQPGFCADWGGFCHWYPGGFYRVWI